MLIFFILFDENGNLGLMGNFLKDFDGRVGVIHIKLNFLLKFESILDEKNSDGLEMLLQVLFESCSNHERTKTSFESGSSYSTRIWIPQE